MEISLERIQYNIEGVNVASRSRNQLISDYLVNLLRNCEEQFSGCTTNERIARREIIPQKLAEFRMEPKFHTYFQNEPNITAELTDECISFVRRFFTDLYDWHSSFHEYIPSFSEFKNFLENVNNIVNDCLSNDGSN